MEKRDEGISVIIEDACPLEDTKLGSKDDSGGKGDFDFEIQIPSRISSSKLVDLNKLLKQNQGQDRLALSFIDNLGRYKRMILPYGINFTDDLKKKIMTIIE